MWATMQALQPVFVTLNSIYFNSNDNDNDTVYDNIYYYDKGYYNDNGYDNHEKGYHTNVNGDYNYN